MQQSMKIGSRVFDLKDHTYVMGILNVTPDSFSDGGRYLSMDAVLNRVETMLNDNVNPWHYHDAELTVLNKEATCIEDGYENRTYCEICTLKGGCRILLR